MIDFFHESGNRAVSIQFLTIIDRGLCIALSQMLVILTEISSWPWALLISTDLIIFRMSSSVKLITDKLDVELRFNKLGNELLFVIGVLFDPKD